MNFLLPLLVGGPDMANTKDLLGINITNYSNNLINNAFFTENKPDIKGYLAGLFEGDGHIWIQKQVRDALSGDKKKHNPRFCITFSMKNEPLAKKLLELIGYGFIRYKLQNNACVLTVSSVAGLKKVVYLINGELKTPKIHQLYNLIDWLNKNHSGKIVKLPLSQKNFSENGWLSGFIDSDGSFSVQNTKKENGAKKNKISCRLRIEQRMFDPITGDSYINVLTQITKFLNCTLLIRKQKSTGNQYYTFAASSKISLNIIIDYLEKHSLYSSKYLDYKDWKQVAILVLDNSQYSDKAIIRVESLKASMNRQRTYFSWSHLDKLLIH